MKNNKEFSIMKMPFLRLADSRKNNTLYIMKSFSISFFPLFLFYFIKYSIIPFLSNEIGFFTHIYPFVFVLFAVLFSFLFEALYFLLILKEEDCFKKSLKSYSIIPALILSFILPINTPIYLLMIACFVANIIAKMLFGGFGYNIFNPAIFAYLFVLSAFYSEINANEIFVDGISSTTPLNYIKDYLLGSNGFDIDLLEKSNLLNMFIGNNSHSIAESSPLICCVSFIYLAFKKVINYKCTIIYLFSSFIICLILSFSLNINNFFAFTLFNLFNGGIFFASVFIITEPVLSPRNHYAKYLYVFFIALFTIFLRFLSDYNEGVASALLFMNLFSIIIDRSVSKFLVSNNLKERIRFVLILFAIIFFIFLYMFLRLKELR